MKNSKLWKFLSHKIQRQHLKYTYICCCHQFWVCVNLCIERIKSYGGLCNAILIILFGEKQIFFFSSVILTLWVINTAFYDSMVIFLWIICSVLSFIYQINLGWLNEVIVKCWSLVPYFLSNCYTNKEFKIV